MTNDRSKKLIDTFVTAAEVAQYFQDTVKRATAAANILAPYIERIPCMSKADLHAQCANQVILAFKSNTLVKHQILQEAYNSALEAEHTNNGEKGEFSNRATNLINDVVCRIYDKEVWGDLVSKCHDTAQDKCSRELSVKQQTIKFLCDQLYTALRNYNEELKYVIIEFLKEVNLEEIVEHLTRNYDIT